jgi:hypothetical protein
MRLLQRPLGHSRRKLSGKYPHREPVIERRTSVGVIYAASDQSYQLHVAHADQQVRSSGSRAFVADTNLKLGSCILIAGVTDAALTYTAGQCFFVTSYTDSTHYSYIQPGAPVNASSSGGTSRMAKFSEAYLSSGVDDGASKIQNAARFLPNHHQSICRGWTRL